MARRRTIHDVTSSRDELIRLVRAMPDDKIDELLKRVRPLAVASRSGPAEKLRPPWPPTFVGMLKDGPVDGSTTYGD